MEIVLKKKKGSSNYKIKTLPFELTHVKVVENYHKFKLHADQIRKIVKVEEQIIDQLPQEMKDDFRSSITYTSSHGNILQIKIHKNEIIDKRSDENTEFFNLIVNPYCIIGNKIEWNMEIYNCTPQFVQDESDTETDSDIEPPEPTPEDIELLNMSLKNKKDELTFLISEKIHESTIHTIDAIEELVKSIL